MRKRHKKALKSVSVTAALPWIILGAYLFAMCRQLAYYASLYKETVTPFILPLVINDQYFVLLYTLIIISIFSNKDEQALRKNAKELTVHCLKVAGMVTMFLQLAVFLFLLPVAAWDAGWGKTIERHSIHLSNTGYINIWTWSGDIVHTFQPLHATICTLILIVLHMVFFGLLVSHSKRTVKGMMIASVLTFFDFQVMNDLPSWCVWISPNTLLRTGILATSCFLWAVGFYLILIILIMCIRSFHERRMLPC